MRGPYICHGDGGLGWRRGVCRKCERHRVAVSRVVARGVPGDNAQAERTACLESRLVYAARSRAGEGLTAHVGATDRVCNASRIIGGRIPCERHRVRRHACHAQVRWFGRRGSVARRLCRRHPEDHCQQKSDRCEGRNPCHCMFLHLVFFLSFSITKKVDYAPRWLLSLRSRYLRIDLNTQNRMTSLRISIETMTACFWNAFKETFKMKTLLSPTGQRVRS